MLRQQPSSLIKHATHDREFLKKETHFYALRRAKFIFSTHFARMANNVFFFINIHEMEICAM